MDEKAYEKVLSDVQHAIEDELGCKALWWRRQIVPVMDGPRIIVEVFRLTGCQNATICYAWANPAPGARPYVVLHRGMVSDAPKAVLSVLHNANRDSELPTESDYWTIVDEHHEKRDGQLVTTTYEHRLPHGTLVRTVTLHREHVAEAIAFVPTPPPAM